jgi:hypothetical protein
MAVKESTRFSDCMTSSEREPVESANERDEGRDIGLVQLVLYGGEFDAGEYVGYGCVCTKKARLYEVQV